MQAVPDGEGMADMLDEAAPALARKIRWRLGFPCIFFMFMSSLDRVNISFAARDIQADLGMSQTAYGFAAGVLFVGFLAGQYPSLFVFQRIGFPRWIGGLAMLWGLATAAIGVVQGPWQLGALRIVIGLAEGGLAPGITLYLGQFATAKERAQTFALPMLAVPLSVILGGPISGALLDMVPPFAMANWRWMVLVQGSATALIGLAAMAWFPATLADARWIGEADRARLVVAATTRNAGSGHNDWSILARPVVWMSALLWFCLLCGSYGIMFWLPQTVRQMTGLNAFEAGLVNALPWIGVLIAMFANARHSDRTGERFWHVAAPAMLAAVSITAAGLLGPGVPALGLLFVAGLGLGGAQGAFWAIPTGVFAPAAMAVGTVGVNILGSAGGLVMPPVIGLVKDATPNPMAPTLMVAGVLLAGATLALAIRAMSRSAAGR
jgi:MFS transporter, ACS family, tartrate transporter